MSLLFDLDAVLSDFSDQMQQNIRYIYSLSLLPKTKVGFHGDDADGIISAVIMKNLNFLKDSVFIPLGYQELRHPEFGQFLKSVDWVAISDLFPFHTKPIRLFCDHHETSKNLPKNADLVLFDQTAPSASYLLAKHFQAELPNSIRELAELTKITDTASFDSAPPLESPKNLDSASLHERARLLDDICRTVEAPDEILSLVNDLDAHQLKIAFFPQYKEKLNHLYKTRRATFEIAATMPITDVLIIIQGTTKIQTSSLIHLLFEKQIKLTCVLYPGKRFTGLSFRLNSEIKGNKFEELRVDSLASTFSGGGHPRAAGGRADSLSVALTQLEEWIKSKNLDYQICDLRKTKTS
jgi:oligoribonuclease NrnB/cAMP/cGMP phosphodiesterase (DHH superfamily)